MGLAWTVAVLHLVCILFGFGAKVPATQAAVYCTSVGPSGGSRFWLEFLSCSQIYFYQCYNLQRVYLTLSAHSEHSSRHPPSYRGPMAIAAYSIVAPPLCGPHCVYEARKPGTPSPASCNPRRVGRRLSYVGGTARPVRLPCKALHEESSPGTDFNLAEYTEAIVISGEATLSI